MLIAAASLTLGGAFGSGIVASGTGILLNSVQRLFSPVEQGGFNGRAPGHRPLLPVSPVFFETAQQKCGHRFVAASSGGIQGMIGLSQVRLSALCRIPVGAQMINADFLVESVFHFFIYHFRISYSSVRTIRVNSYLI